MDSADTKHATETFESTTLEPATKRYHIDPSNVSNPVETVHVEHVEIDDATQKNIAIVLSDQLCKKIESESEQGRRTLARMDEKMNSVLELAQEQHRIIGALSERDRARHPATYEDVARLYADLRTKQNEYTSDILILSFGSAVLGFVVGALLLRR